MNIGKKPSEAELLRWLAATDEPGTLDLYARLRRRVGRWSWPTAMDKLAELSGGRQKKRDRLEKLEKATQSWKKDWQRIRQKGAPFADAWSAPVARPDPPVGPCPEECDPRYWAHQHCHVCSAVIDWQGGHVLRPSLDDGVLVMSATGLFVCTKHRATVDRIARQQVAADGEDE